MKANNDNVINKLMLILALLPSITYAQAQWNTTSGNSVTSTSTYLGTNGSSTSPLQIKTVEMTGSGTPQPINFHTNNSTNPVMQIDINGFVGIGTTSPVTVLHLNRNTAIDVTTRYTNPNTVGLYGDGFDVGVEAATGIGIMTVFAPNLSSGQYQYALIINGKVFETKKMLKGK